MDINNLLNTTHLNFNCRTERFLMNVNVTGGVILGISAVRKALRGTGWKVWPRGRHPNRKSFADSEYQHDRLRQDFPVADSTSASLYIVPSRGFSELCRSGLDVDIPLTVAKDIAFQAYLKGTISDVMGVPKGVL